MKKLVFCIPSYKRPEKIKTLETVPNAIVYVAENEYENYKKTNPDANIKAMPNEVQGNISRVRNYILDDNKDNAVVILDDDISAIMREIVDKEKEVKKWESIDKDEIEDLFCGFADICEEWGFDYFGLQCLPDQTVARMMAPFSTHSFIGGPVQGFLPTNECRYDERLPLKEDYDMTLQQCEKKRGCLRFNLYSYRAKQSEQTGGCACYRNLKKEKEQLELLQKKWGKEIVRVDKTNKTDGKSKVLDYNPIINVPIGGV